MQKIIDFSQCEYSIRHGSYGGRAGDKDGILYNKKPYIIKYPKSSRQLQNINDMSYTTSPLSEYIGSHIYEILGFDTHETLLGYRNNKIVVACKDFCKTPSTKLMEMRTIKNGANKELETILEQQMQSSASGDMVNLNEQILHLKYNPTLQKIDNVTERFWDMVVIDILIDNNDRNNGNWGILIDEETGTYRLAPIYDNGNAFSNKASDNKLREYMRDESLINRLTGNRTAYEYNSKMLSAKKLLKAKIPELESAIIRNVPKITENIEQIKSFINEIPETYQGLPVCSNIRKQYYTKGIEVRTTHLLQPIYEDFTKKPQQKTMLKQIKSMSPPPITKNTNRPKLQRLEPNPNIPKSVPPISNADTPEPQETVKKKTPPRTFINKNNKVNPEDDIEAYGDLEKYDPLERNTDPEHIERMQRLVKNTNPHRNDHTQVPEKKYGLPDNNKGLREMDQRVERMKENTKNKNFGLGD